VNKRVIKYLSIVLAAGLAANVRTILQDPPENTEPKAKGKSRCMKEKLRERSFLVS
jgi:hypothetical protein